MSLTIHQIKELAIKESWAPDGAGLQLVNFLCQKFGGETPVVKAKALEESTHIPKGYVLVTQFQRTNALCKKLKMGKGKLLGIISRNLNIFKEIIYKDPSVRFHHKYYIDEEKAEEILLKCPFRNSLERQAVAEHKRELRLNRQK